jgi:two-component system, LytTR family, sensor kinase
MEVEDDVIVVSNNLQLTAFPQALSGIGLANLNERFKILLQKEIEIVKTDTTFIVKLPLK